jgi:type III secretion protein L
MEIFVYLFKINENLKIHAGQKKIPKGDFLAVIDAKEMIKAAHEEASNIIKEAKKEAQNIHQKAKEEGYKEGLEPFNKHILYFDDRIKNLRHELQKSLLSLVHTTTKRIIGEGLKAHPEIVVDVVTEAIKNVTASSSIKLLVNKQDIAILEEKKEDLKKLFEHLDSFLIEEREDVERGACIIQTERGILNANLENQFHALKNALENSKKI